MPVERDSSVLIDRFLVVVSFLQDESAKLLGVPMPVSGTGKATGKVVVG